MKSNTTASFDTQLDGRDVCIEFERHTVWSSGMEGQDADGNRGVWMASIDEDYAEGITLSWYNDETGNAHNDIPLAELLETQQKTVQALVDDWLEKNEPGL